MKFARSFFLGLLAVGLVSAVNAQTTVVSNLGQTYGNGIAVGKSSGFDFSEGFNFTTGSTGANFSSVTVVISGTNGSPTGFSMALYSNVSTSGPSGLLATLSGSSTPTTIGSSYSYTPDSPVLLSPNTTYWFVASASSTALNTSFSLQGTDSDNEDLSSLSGWSIGNTRMFTNNGGASWGSFADVPVFSVQASVVPEPSTYAISIGALSLVACVVYRHHRTKPQAKA